MQEGFEGGDRRTAEGGRHADCTEPERVPHVGVHRGGAAWGPGGIGPSRSIPQQAVQTLDVQSQTHQIPLALDRAQAAHAAWAKAQDALDPADRRLPPAICAGHIFPDPVGCPVWSAYAGWPRPGGWARRRFSSPGPAPHSRRCRGFPTPAGPLHCGSRHRPAAGWAYGRSVPALHPTAAAIEPWSLAWSLTAVVTISWAVPIHHDLGVVALRGSRPGWSS